MNGLMAHTYVYIKQFQEHNQLRGVTVTFLYTSMEYHPHVLFTVRQIAQIIEYYEHQSFLV